MPIGYKRIIKKGDKFGNLEVIGETLSKPRKILCKNIISGEIKEVRLCHLISGASRGFINSGESNPNFKHGMSKTRQWNIWMGIKARCNNKNDPAYKNYGARGIIICDEWMKFENFWEDMKKGYCKEKTIERIDNSKGYYKENCKWILKKEQANNTRKTKYVFYKNEKISLIDLSEKFKIKRRLLYQRIFVYKWDVEKALQKIDGRKLRKKRKKITHETRLKISESHKGKVFTKEHRENISKANRKTL